MKLPLFVEKPCVSVCCLGWLTTVLYQAQLSATDLSARTTMKGAAKCDKHCELQNSVNQSGFERILCFWDIPESMPASVSIVTRVTITNVTECITIDLSLIHI